VLHQRIDYLRRLLRLLDDESVSERIRSVTGGDDLEPPPRLRPLDAPTPAAGTVRLNEPAATAEAVCRLIAHDPDRLRGRLAHPGSPVGQVVLDAEVCTACGACATTCPSGALHLETAGDEIVISYAAAACVGCGRCASACPEAAAAALRVDRTTDLAALTGGRVVVKAEPAVHCLSCGRPIAPRQLLGRIGELLDDDAASQSLLRILGERCIDCRGAALNGETGARAPVAAGGPPERPLASLSPDAFHGCERPGGSDGIAVLQNGGKEQ
jgi:ferredoxin